MKDLLKNFISKKNEYLEEKSKIEKSLETFIGEIPNWEDRLESIIISSGSCFSEFDPSEDISSQLILKVRDVSYLDKSGIDNTEKISFSIKTITGHYVQIGYFPLDYLTNPTYTPDYEYLHEKLERRKAYIKGLEEERDYAIAQINLENIEIARIEKLLSKKRED